jgi:single-strand DNA-binding protein
MASVNLFAISGNVTKDLKLRHTSGGVPMVTYTVAADNVYFDRSGKKHEDTDFVPVTTYGAQAENDAKYLKQGSKVAVSGRIRSWYKPNEGKGGFNFEAKDVQYFGGTGAQNGASDDDSPPSSAPVTGDHDEWVRDYASAERSSDNGKAGR